MCALNPLRGDSRRAQGYAALDTGGRPFIMKRIIHHLHKHLNSRASHKKFKHALLVQKRNAKNILEDLIFNVHYLVFVIVFIVGAIPALWITSDTYYRFVFSDKLFDIADIFKSDAASLLSQRFSCPTASSSWSWCGFDVILLILLLLFVEGFSIWIIIKNRKLIAKKYLVSYFLFQQVYPVFLFFLYVSIPASVISDLSEQARQDIAKSAAALSNTDERAKLGIIDTADGIAEALEKTDTPPLYFEYEPEAEAILQVQKISHTEKDTLYRSVIVPSIVYASESASVKAQIQFDVMVFPATNTLIVKAVKQTLIEQLAPILARKLIATNYASFVKWKKNPPKISVLEDEKYIELIKKKEEQRKKDYQYNIQEVRSSIRDAENAIPRLQIAISATDAEYNRYESYGREWLKGCENVLSMTDKVCVEGKQTIEESLNNLRSQKGELETQTKEWTELKPKLLWSLGQWQKAYENFLKDPVTPEYQDGIFESPSSIFIKWHSKDNYFFSYYVNIVLHEYLHYENGSATGKLPQFLEEGVTDYLTTELTKKLLERQSLVVQIPDYSGYAELVQIVAHLFKNLPTEDLLGAYFARQETKIKELVDKKYEIGTYDQIRSKSDQIYYTPVIDVDTKMSLVNDVKALLPETVATESGAINNQ